MAEIVGKVVLQEGKGSGLSSVHNLRCKAGRSLRNGNLDLKSPYLDVTILQTHPGTVQTCV